MTRWTRRLMLAFVLGLVAMLAIPEDAFAQRRGGGSRSRSRSRSKPRASKPRASKPKKSSKKAKKNQFGSSKNKTAKAKSKADRAAYEKAKKSGKAFGDRKSAAADFKKKNAGKYGSKYASKPAKRPDHVPQSTSVGGTTYNVTYNQSHGGYGYMGVGGRWMMYDTMADVAMMSIMMRRGGYHYGPAPAVYVESSGMGIVGYVVGGVFLVIIIGAIVVVVRKN